MRLALRRLLRAPAFTVATTLTLALGIGATTSIFTLAHAVLLKSLPVARPDELYRVGKEAHCCYLAGYSQDKEFSLVSYDLYKYLRDNTRGFAELAAFPAADLIFGIRRAGSSEAAQTYGGEFVSGNYFATFGIGAYAGRTLSAADDQAGAAPVAVMSYRLWQERYGSDPSVIGSTFHVDERPFTVVGIAPPGFFGDTLRNTPPDFFLPLNAEPYVESEADLKKYGQHWLELIGRMAPGARPVAIEAEMRVRLKQWLRSHWGEMSASDRAKFSEQTLFLVPGGAGISSMRDRYERWLQILMAVTGFVLLIVCANVASLMLVRGMERRRQTSLSMALGAGASRIVRQDLTESIVLSVFGGAVGLAVAFAGTRLILNFVFPSINGAPGVPIDASPSLPVLLFAFGVSVLAGLAFGIAPGWIATRTDPIEALRGASRVTASAGSVPRRALVVFQIALSLALLSVSGLLTSALHALETQDFGFEQDRRMVAKINPKLAGYRPSQLSQLYRRIHDAIANIPGVSSTALCLYSPPGGGWGADVWLDGRAAPGPRDDNSSQWDRITPGYFDVIGTPIVRGRSISEEDTAASRRVAVINEAFARKFFKNEDPIGRHFGRNPEASREFEVVGVAKDARYLANNIDRPAGPIFFLPEAQADYSKSAGSLFLHDIVISTKPGANLSAAEVRQAMASVDPGMPIISIQTLREKVDLQFTQQRLTARLTSFFGVLSLILASVGLYGVIAYNAGRRTGEVGVRIALGATRGDVVRLVLKGAIGLIVAGLSIGLPLTFAAGRLLENQLYGIKPYHPAVTVPAVAVLGLSALLASVIPAIRASLISPLEVLRAE
ncbi:MAG TPA: ABC transporter permease [Candidatus Acidoferrales bacterium]|nr:ABC transporter permease [Candidatus Acidoferrales bacterium]